MKRIFVAMALLASACGGSDTKKSVDTATAAETPEAVGSGEVVVSMEGDTLILPKVDWQVSRIEDVDNERRYLLTTQDLPLSLNLNVKLAAVPSSFPATFTVPVDNNPNITIDLNFFNQNREAKRMKKRIIFSEGTIDVRAMSEDSLDISFDGAGHPLGDSENFPIAGSARVSK